MSVTLTEKAAKEVQRVMSEQKMPEATLLRVGVVGGGCSGFQYSLGFDTKSDPAKDELSEQHGIKLAIDRKRVDLEEKRTNHTIGLATSISDQSTILVEDRNEILRQMREKNG